MIWNWQQPDWPNFSWDRGRLATAEREFLVGGGMLVGTVKHLGTDERDQLTIEAMSTEAVTTSEIEGETLDRASVQSSIRKQLGLSTDNRRVRAAEQGIAEMMVDLYRSFAAPLSDETLFAWHRMLVGGRRDLKDVARYRTGEEPMQVVSGAIYEPKVHFEAPPSTQVAPEMTRFIIIAAVIEAHAQQIKTTLAFIGTRHRTPKSRLKAFVREFTAQSEIVAEHGCPLGSLCSELGKRIKQPSFAVAELMRLLAEWAEDQFRSLGRPDARDLAFDLMAAYEGSALLANTMHDPDVLSRAARRVDRWIDSL